MGCSIYGGIGEAEFGWLFGAAIVDDFHNSSIFSFVEGGTEIELLAGRRTECGCMDERVV